MSSATRNIFKSICGRTGRGVTGSADRSQWERDIATGEMLAWYKTTISDGKLQAYLPRTGSTTPQVKGSAFTGAGTGSVTGLLTTDTITSSGTPPTCTVDGTLTISADCWDIEVHRDGVLWAYWPGINVGGAFELDASGNGHHLYLTTTTIVEAVDGSGSNWLNEYGYALADGTQYSYINPLTRVTAGLKIPAVIGATGEAAALSFDPAMTIDTSIGGVWSRQGVVISPDTDPDRSNVQEPCVLYDTDPQILVADNVFKMWYSGGWAAQCLNYAESLDGITWTKYANNPVVDGAWRASVVKHNGTYYHYLNGDLYTSPDGITLTGHGTGGIHGGQGWDDGGVSNTCVWVENDLFYIMYESTANPPVPTNTYHIGLATSADGITWTKYAGNPVLSLTEGSISDPCVKKINGIYYAWVHKSPLNPTPTDGYRYKSTDLINWELDSASLYRSVTVEGVYGDTSGAQIADLDLVEVGGETYMYYTSMVNQIGTTGTISLVTASCTLENLVKTLENSSNVLTGTTKNRALKLSCAAGVAFVDQDYPRLFTDYVGHTLTLTDSTGKNLTGIIRAKGSGVTYGNNLLPNGGFETNTTNWWINASAGTMAIVSGGYSGNCLEITHVSGYGPAASTNPYIPVTQGAAVLASVYFKAGTGGAGELGGVQLKNNSGTLLNSHIYASTSTWSLSQCFDTIGAASLGAIVTVIKASSLVGTTMLFDSAELKQILSPSVHGVVICSDFSGTTQSWASEDVDFDRSQDTYIYTITLNPGAAQWDDLI